ncbi:MAG: NUDIX domain-containing protein [Oscillospiraceae bacterium]|jgi:8-oxo-dGTP diphosphatase|nr:NUDIX domain-containing protein [Oscillospiraceae bacterium]
MTKNANLATDNKFFFSVKVIIFYNKKFLIIKRSGKARGDNFYWDLPGGRLEFLEKPLTTLHREIKEETGLSNIQALYPINLWDFMKTPNTQVIGATYLCKTFDEKVILSDEHLDYKWISKEEIPNYNICGGIVHDMNEWDWNKILSDLSNN